MTTKNNAASDVQPVELAEPQGDARAQFEAWAHAQSYRGGNIITDRDPDHPDVYAYPNAQLTWQCWKAALAARQPGAQVPFGWWLEDANGVGYFSRRMQPAALYAHRTTPGYSATPLHAAPPAQGIDLHRLVPPEWLSELIGGQIDDLTPGQAWRQGFNQCRERTQLLVEQALGFPADQKRDAAPGVAS